MRLSIVFPRILTTILASSIVLAGSTFSCSATSHTKYIRKDIDLQGKTIIIPEGTTLVFKGGMIRNGKVVGNRSIIKAPANQLFENVEIEGTWENAIVYSQWLPFNEEEGFDNGNAFISLMNLCNGECNTDLYFNSGVYYTSTKLGSSLICVPSNTYWHNQATIVEIPNDFTKCALVLIDKSKNVVIEGGVFVGDLKKHMGTDGEWSHGIKCAGANNVVLNNLVCREFWGDGIDLIEGRDYQTKEYCNCNGITLNNVSCVYNRRQGMSIEAAVNVSVNNSEFAYTGQMGFTKPGAGIDIEPWRFDCEKIKNISFLNCNFHDNRGYDFHCVPNWKLDKNDYLQRPNNVLLNDCSLGMVYIGSTNNISFINCLIGVDVSSLKDREGFVSGNDLAILRISRTSAQVIDCIIEDNVDDVFLLAVRNSNYEYSLPVIICNNELKAKSSKRSGTFKYIIDISASDCRLEGNSISAPQGILIRTDRPQTGNEQIVLSKNEISLIGREWKKACLTFRSTNTTRRFKSVSVQNNIIEGYPFVMANDNSTHLIKYSGTSNVPIEQHNSRSTIEIGEGSIQKKKKGLIEYRNGRWQ